MISLFLLEMSLFSRIYYATHVDGSVNWISASATIGAATWIGPAVFAHSNVAPADPETAAAMVAHRLRRPASIT
jgi:hypothetical protein